MLIESLEGRRVLTSGVPFESFDGVFDPALPAGWVSTGTGAWTTVTGNSHTANIHAFIPNPSFASSGVLESVAFMPTAQSSIVNFAHFYNTEATYDGGVLEISIPSVNNGAFQDILVAGGSFITGGYNSTLQGSGSLSGRQAWSGNSGGYVATSVQLPPSAIDQNIQLAWSFASDGSVPGVGWRVDSISLSGPIAPIDLANLAPSQGTTIFGADANDESGKSVSIVGDVNGDGYDDMLISAPNAEIPGGTLPQGASYLVFGSQTPLATIDLFGEGIVIFDSSSTSGRTAAPAGDVNGDGLADFFIGDDRQNANAGASFVVFGKTDWSANTGNIGLNLNSLGAGGIKFTGIDTGDQSGFSVSSAGDVNGDGFDDLLVGARSANSVTNGRTLAGESYLIFGKGDWTANQIVNLATVGQVGGTAGVTFFGSDSADQSGRSVSGIGDINGDGFDDLAIGAFLSDGTTTSVRSDSGETAILFGKSNWTGITSIDLATLGSNNGLTIFGVEAGDYSGISVSRVGDFNGDGFDDIAIGAYRADAATNGKGLAGDSYIVFGASSLFGRTSIDLATLGQPNQPTGITIFGADVGDFSGYSISGGGDLNGDGFDDLVIGAKQGDALLNLKSAAGDTYVVFGGPSLPPTIDLATLGANALAIFGANGSDQSGTSVSLGGDVNGDGFDDLLIGANLAASVNNSRINAGESYLIFGGNGFTNSIMPGFLGTNTANFINGSYDADIINGAEGDDFIDGNFGADVLLGGRGNDTLQVGDFAFSRVNGGTGGDTLDLKPFGSGRSFDLTAIPDNRIIDIETIDISNDIGNTLTLNQREVLNISSTSNTLTVIGNSGSRVFFESGWTKQADNAGFQVFTKGAATLRVSVGVPVLVNVIDLANLGSAGSTINGAAAADYAGQTVSNAGDVNGDGYDDFIIGANRADLSGQPNTDNRGKSYVLFGGPSLPATINLLDNLGTAGITITGQAVGDNSGGSVSSAGDVNGDGFDDLIVGAQGADPGTPAREGAGKSYVIFGGASLSATIDLANLGSAGITIFGADVNDQSGISVSSAGDINGDGFDDLVIGARLANASGNLKSDAGDSYVIFGAASLPATIDLASLGSSGITIFGADVNDQSGSSVSSAGDVNGDGFDDLIIGARGADASGNAKSYAGDSYVIFGAASLPATIDLASLGSAGITIFGADANDASGISVSSAGDVNGDGFDDLIIGANFADASGNSKSAAGDSYVIFGAASLPATIDLANLGSAGITFFGADANDQSGISVSSAGDVNGDGFDDLLIGATFADASGNSKSSAGDSYVIFGAASLPATIDLANLGSAGITIFGADAADASGRSVTSAGDVNGDGFDDLLIGAIYADASGNGKSNAGESYVIFGGNGFTNSILAQNIGTSGDDPFINGTLPLFGFDILNGGDGNDQLVGNGGTDILLGGRGDDILRVNDLDFKRLIGGNGTDELRLTGGIFSLNLLNIPDNRIVDIERIEINASSLTLTQREVLNISSTSNTLTVIGTPSGRVGFEPGWTKGSDSGGFQVFTKGAATLRVSVGVPVSVTLIELANLGSAGTTINGAAAGDLSGRSVSNAGDVNGDGYDDVIIGAYLADAGTPARIDAGKTYVIFGGPSLPATINLSDNLGASGFTILGQAADDRSTSVSTAGDINGDGFDDLIIGAGNADRANFPANAPYSDNNAGKSYVIFGKSNWSTTPTITLSDNIEATNAGVSGITIFGEAASDISGRSVSGAGDVNGDGFDDLLIGAYFGDRADLPNPGNNAGKSYLIFGKSDWSTTRTITLTGNLAATNTGVTGITILGQAAEDYSGASVSSAGDLNGDGFDDIVIGAGSADPANAGLGNNKAGKSYVIFGGSSLPATITLADNIATANPGVFGITIFGANAGDETGEARQSVSNAGDVNGDGFDDLIVGAIYADPSTPLRSNAGKSYVIFGKADWSTTPTVTLSDTIATTNPGVTGFTILGQAAGDYSGRSVSGAGDVNGDGFDDLIVGAFGADPGTPARNDAGKSYVIFGKSDWSTMPTVTLSDTLATTNPGVTGFTILGQAADDQSGTSVSSAGDVNGDGFDDLIIGASRADAANAGPGDNRAGKSYILYGGNGFTNSILPANLGNSSANTINGTSAANILNGANGDDILVGLGGVDILLGGRGNDTLAISNPLFRRIVGGNGNDTLRLDGTGLTLDLTTIRDNRIVDIEEINITGSGNNTLTLTAREVLNLSSHSNTLIVRRNDGDIVNRGAGWTQIANETISSIPFEVFTQGRATLKVQASLPPVVGFSSTPVAYIENAAPLAIFSGVTITDVDSPVLTGGVLTISNTNGDLNDRLTIASSSFVIVSGNSILVGGQVVGTFTGGNGTTPLVVTLTNQASLNRVVAILSLIRFSNVSDAPSSLSRIISVRVTDGSGGTSAIVNRTVGVTPVNDIPVVTLPTTPATYVENAAPIAVFTNATVTDADTPVLTGGVLTIINTNGDLNDRLSIDSSSFVIVSGNSILVGGQVVGTFSGGTGTTPLVVTLTSQASLNRVLAILSLIRFSNISEAPSGVSRIISVRVTDGSGGTSAIVNRTVGVTPVNDAPIVTLPMTPLTYIENAAPLAVFTSANVTDADTPVLTGGVLTITNTNGDLNDRLSIASSSFVIVSGNSISVGGQVVGTFTGGTGITPLVVTLTNQASLNRVLAVLSLIRFSNISEAPSGVSRIISVRLTDGSGGTSVIVNRTVGVTPVIDAPIVTLPTTPVTYVENSAPIAVFTAATLTDADTPVLTGGVLTITNTNGDVNDRSTIASSAFVIVSGNSILVGGQVVGTFTGGTGTTPLVVTFTNQASLNRVVAILSLIRFSNISDAPSGVSRIVSVRVTDGSGGTSAIVNRTVGVTPVNDVPVIGSIGPAVTFTRSGPRVLVFSSTSTITDLDNTVLTGGRLIITNANGQATDSLAIIPNTSITVSGANVSYNGGVIGTFTGGVGTTPLVFTFNNQATPARIRLVLLSVGFSNSLTTPSATPRTISVQITDGFGGTSALQIKLVNVV